MKYQFNYQKVKYIELVKMKKSMAMLYEILGYVI